MDIQIQKACCCSVAWLCPTLCDPRSAAHQTSLSFMITWSLLKLVSIESVMSSNHLVLCPLLLLPSIPASGSFPVSQLFTPCGQSIGASASVLLINIQGWFPLGLTGLISFLFKGLSPSLFVWYASCIFHFQSFSKFTGHLWFFQWSCMDVRVRLWRKLSAE